MKRGFFSHPLASVSRPKVPRTFEFIAASSGASKITDAAEWMTASTSRESSARSSSPSPKESACTSPSKIHTFSATRSSKELPSFSRRRENASAPRTSFSNLSFALFSREGRTSRYNRSRVGRLRSIFSTSAVPRKPVPPVRSTALPRYASSSMGIIFSCFPDLALRPIEKGAGILPVPPQDQSPSNERVQDVRRRLSREKESYRAHYHHQDSAQRRVPANQHYRPPKGEQYEPHHGREPDARPRARGNPLSTLELQEDRPAVTGDSR